MSYETGHMDEHGTHPRGEEADAQDAGSEGSSDGGGAGRTRGGGAPDSAADASAEGGGEQGAGEQAAGEDGSGEAGGRRGISGGIQKGIGVLSAFKEALEETITEARERGDLSTDRAKEVLHGAVEKAREAAGGARERFDFATEQELDALRKRVADLEARVARLDGGDATPSSPEGSEERAGP